MERCVFCQGEVESTTRRCSQCGKAQPQPTAGQPVGAAVEALTKPCPQCGDLLPNQAQFCGKCGFHLAPITVFLSYSHHDADFVARLQADLLAQGIRVWIDKEGIEAGTPDWEEALRQALQQEVQALVLVASPHSRQSPYVKDEWDFATMFHRPVYPIWATGEQWLEAIPLGKGHTQYIDARGASYESGVQTLVASLHKGSLRAGKSPTPPPPKAAPPSVSVEPRNPYKGLQAFGAEDARDFFGREKLIAELLDALKVSAGAARQDASEARLLGVLGPSGSGKSSIMLAGLLPRLKAGALPGSEHWIYLKHMTPEEHPLDALALALAEPLGKPGEVMEIRKGLEDDTGRGLHLLARSLVRQAGAKVILPIDQFEELFTLTRDAKERRRFVELLLTAITEPRGPLVVLLTMRSDFYDRLTQYPELAKLIKAQHHLVLPMDLEDLRAVIEGPAALPDVQLTFEGTLVGDLLFDVLRQPGSLPLLQFTLDQLFQRRQGNQLTLAAYRDMGGVRGALARQAETTYEHLPSDSHRKLARTLFLRLIVPGATEQDTTRRRAALEELTLADSKQVEPMQAVIDALVTARLLVTNEAAGVTTIEVCHEALIREWPKLRDWLREAREDVYLQQTISKDAAEWERRSKQKDRLYRGAQLHEARAWAGRNFPSMQEAAFIRTATRRRNRVLVSAVSLALAVLLVVGVGSYYIVPIIFNTTSVTTFQDNGAGSLRQDIENALPGSTITFASGLRGTLQLTASLHITKPLTIRGPGASSVTIASTPRHPYFVVLDTGVSASISGLTFKAGILNGGNLTVTNTTVSGVSDTTHNDAGAGIQNAFGATLTLTNSTVSNNTVEDGDGGGIYNDGKITMTSSTISNNTALTSGGGILNDTDGIMTLTNTTISGNTVKATDQYTGDGEGGGIFNAGELTLTNSFISDNTAQASAQHAGNGGGIFNTSFGTNGANTTSGTLIVTNTTISGNTAQSNTSYAGNGGGIFNAGNLTLSNSTISGNHASDGYGGGIENAATMMLTNSTISDNDAGRGSGGGIENLADTTASNPVTSTLTFCTMYRNTANQGSEINSEELDPTTGNVISGSPSLLQVNALNSIVAGDQDGAGPAISGPFITQGYNLLQDFRGDTNANDTVVDASADLSQFIGALGKNGGPTETDKLLRPPSGSNPAVGAIPQDACQIQDPATNQVIKTDQRGMPRPGANKQQCDIGAYESSG